MGRKGQRRKIARGIYRDGSGMAAVVHANSHRRELRFPPNTPLRTIRAAIDETRSQLRKLPHAERHTFAADATRYLQRVQNTLSSFKDRERHLNAWLPMFGHVRTLSLSQHVAAINDHLHRWRNELSASSCNQRRDALTNCVKVLYGRRAALELADIIRFQQPPPSDEWVPRKVITSVLMHLTPGTKTEARLTLMHWSGMRPSQMGRMTRENFHLNERLPFLVVPRGKRGRPSIVPLGPEGLAAVQSFFATNAFGRWSNASANKALARAARKAEVEPFTVYAIRHSFATTLRHTGTDVADIQTIYGHTNAKTTEIYARKSMTKLAEAIARLNDDDTQGPTRPRDNPKTEVLTKQ